MAQSSIRSAVTPPTQYVRQENAKASNGSAVRSRRKSNSLGGDPRGDTGAAAMATLSEMPSPLTPTAPQARPSEKTRHSKRRKAKTLFRRWKTISLRHTWLNPLIICLLVVAFYLLNPTPSNPLHSFLFLSYPLSRTATPSPYAGPQTLYGKGPKDFCFVAFYTVFLSFTREFLMQRLIRPIAIRAGIRARGKLARFMEQFYTAVYFAVFGPFGLYVMRYASPLWYFRTAPMFEFFPHREHVALFKAYYLLQASYWMQQAIVLCLMLEKPRKDFKELVAHHIITLALIGLSYRFHFATMGLAVYITMDISDFFLATSKVLNYLDSVIVGPYFAMFVFIWIYLRHYLNLRFLWAVATEFATVGPFELHWETQQYKCWISQYITFALLFSLQAVNVFWLFYILRIGYRYLANNVKKDERSDDEDGDEEEDEQEPQKKQEESSPPEVLVNGQPVEEKHEGQMKLRSRKN
ncbi:MAG: hypothetical protein M1821_000158 [Bathelium mastoideum]|nr:MAG: hypothetical protein M1821_000158 [Bathelium mastoideum]KAI9687809.1 MAG: hypothetical protein M1822_001889 [Bathelium mastoideum]